MHIFPTVGEYIALLLAIPDNCLTTWDAMNKFFAEAYNTELAEPEPYSHWQSEVDGVEILYWKIVGNTGFVPKGERTMAYEDRIARLTEHNFVVVPCGRENMNRRVENYKLFFYDLSLIDRSKILNITIPSKKSVDAFFEMLLNPIYYTCMSKDMLINIITGNRLLKPTENVLKQIENAENELKRRGIKLPK